MMRYAGMNDKLSSLGIYELNPAYDQSVQNGSSHCTDDMVFYGWLL